MTDQQANKPSSESKSTTELFPQVYAELRALASSYLKGQPSHTLQPTALVHEAYMKLAGNGGQWADREHFAATAAKAMRQALVDHARRKKADKRGGNAARSDIDPDEVQIQTDNGHETRVLELDEMLTQLSTRDARAGQVAEMRLFGGMSQDQIATALGVSRKTIVLDWRFARAFLVAKAGPAAEDENPPKSTGQ